MGAVKSADAMVWRSAMLVEAWTGAWVEPEARLLFYSMPRSYIYIYICRESERERERDRELLPRQLQCNLVQHETLALSTYIYIYNCIHINL